MTGNNEQDTRIDFCVTHLRSACLQAAEAKLIDSGQTVDRMRMHAVVTGAIFCSVAAVEAFVNEVHFSVNRIRTLSSKGPTLQFAMDKFYKDSFLVRLNMFVLFATGEPIDLGAGSAQEISALNDFRNTLVHFRPAWPGGEDAEHKAHVKLAGRLSGKFALNSSFPADDKVFPRKFMGYGAAKWAADTAKQFIIDSSSRLDWDQYIKNLTDPIYTAP